MSKNNSKLFDALHIKRFTKGTSNELSLSVLDAARDSAKIESGKPSILPGSTEQKASTQQAEGKKKSSRTTTFQTPSARVVLSEQQGSFNESFDTCIGEFEQKVKTKKRIRRRKNIVKGLIGVLALVAIASVAGYFFFGEYENYQKYVQVLEESLAETSETDGVFIELDSVVNNPLSDESEKKVEDLREKMFSAQNMLFDARIKAQQASSGLHEVRAQNQASTAVDAINNRLAMLDAGQTLLDEIKAANKAVSSLDAAWEKMMGADTLAREAITLVAAGTTENIQASQAKNQEALDLFVDAKAEAETAEKQYNKAEFSQLKEYLSKRAEALSYAIASDQALLDKNKEEAQVQNDLATSADEEAISLAKNIPDNVHDLLLKKYEENTKEQQSKYNEAKSMV